MPGSALQYRIVVWVLRLGLPLLVILGGVVYTAHRGAMRLLEPLRWYGEVAIEEVSFDLGGMVHAKSISYRPFGAKDDATVTARGVDISTPGLSWLVSAGLAGDESSPAEKRRAAAIKAGGQAPNPEPRALPPIGTLSASAEAIELGDVSWLPPDLQWIGPATGSPFESLGCGSGRRFDAEVLEALGVPTGPLKGEFRLDATGDRAKVEVRVFAEGRSSTAWSGDVRLKEPARFFDTDWQDMALAAEQWLVTDESFVVARNRYCARLARVTRQGYVDLHARVIERELARLGLGISPEALEVFKRFDGRGGELSWHSRPSAPLNRAAFAAMPLEEKLAKLQAELSLNGENPQPFQLAVLPPEAAAAIASADPSAAPSTGWDIPPLPGANAGAQGASGAVPSTAQPPPTPVQATAPTQAAPVQSSPAASGATASSSATPPPKASPPAATTASTPALTGTAPAGTGTPSGTAGPTAGASGAAAPTAGSAPGATSATPPASSAAAGSAPAESPKPPAEVAKVKAKPLPSYGRIRFDDLERAVGRVIAVDTRFGTRRVGKVVSFNRAAVTIEINEKGTTLPLTVPRGTVQAIQLVSPEPG